MRVAVFFSAALSYHILFASFAYTNPHACSIWPSNIGVAIVCSRNTLRDPPSQVAYQGVQAIVANYVRVCLVASFVTYFACHRSFLLFWLYVLRWYLGEPG